MNGSECEQNLERWIASSEPETWVREHVNGWNGITMTGSNCWPGYESRNTGPWRKILWDCTLKAYETVSARQQQSSFPRDCMRLLKR
jgi:hypothetical protein